MKTHRFIYRCARRDGAFVAQLAIDFNGRHWRSLGQPRKAKTPTEAVEHLRVKLAKGFAGDLVVLEKANGKTKDTNL